MNEGAGAWTVAVDDGVVNQRCGPADISAGPHSTL